MKDIETKREREKKMISQMIALYCHRLRPRPLRALPVHGDEDLLRQLPRALLQT